MLRGRQWPPVEGKAHLPQKRNKALIGAHLVEGRVHPEVRNAKASILNGLTKPNQCFVGISGEGITYRCLKRIHTSVTGACRQEVYNSPPKAFNTRVFSAILCRSYHHWRCAYQMESVQ